MSAECGMPERSEGPERVCGEPVEHVEGRNVGDPEPVEGRNGEEELCASWP